MYVECRFLCLAALSVFFTLSFGQEERLCADPKCREPIAEGKLLLKNYFGERPGLASMSQGDTIYIYSKPVAKDGEFYEVEVFDKKDKKKSVGYAHTKLIKVTKTRVPKSKLVRVIRLNTPNAKTEENTVANSTSTVSPETPAETPQNASSVIDVSPPSDSNSALVDVTSTVASATVPPGQYVPGGVMAELGNGGPPPTPYEVTDGTTIQLGIDGEMTIVPTSTNPPSLNTEYTASVTESEPEVAPNKTEEVGGQDENDDEDGDDEEGDDEEDGDEDGEEVESEENSEEAVSQEVESRETRDLPPGSAQEHLADVARQLDMLSNAEVGKNQDLDEQVLAQRKAKMSENLKPTVRVAQPVVSPPSIQMVDKQPSPQTELYPPPATGPAPKSEGSPTQPETASSYQSSQPDVESAQPAEPSTVKSEAMETPPGVDQTVTASASDKSENLENAVQDAVREPVTAEPAADIPLAVAQNLVNEQDDSLIIATPQEPIALASGDGLSLPDGSQNTEVPSSENTAGTSSEEANKLQSRETVGAQTPEVLTENEPSPQTKLPPLQMDDTLPNNLADPSESLDLTAESTSSYALNSTDIPEVPIIDTSPSEEGVENSVPDAGYVPNFVPPSFQNNSTNLEDEKVAPELQNTIKNDLPGMTDPYGSEVDNSTVSSTEEQVPLDPYSSSENVEQEKAVEPSPPPYIGQRPPMYPGLFPPANQPQVIEETISIGKDIGSEQIPPPSEPITKSEVPSEVVGSVEQVTPPPEATTEPQVAKFSEGVGSAEQVTPPPEATIEPQVAKFSEGVGSVEQVTPPPEAIVEVLSEVVPEVVSADSEESPGIFSGVFSVFSNMFGSSEDQKTAEVPAASSYQPPPPAVDNINGECKNLEDLESDCADAPGPPHLWHVFEKTVPETSYSLLYLIVTAITLLVFTLGYYFIESSRQNAPLIQKINALTHDLQVATSQLEARPVQESVDNSGILASIQEELAEVKKRNAALQLQVDSLQNELDSSADAGMELNKMVTDLLAEKQSANALLMSVEHLQGQLDTQQKVIDDMNRSLLEKIEENKVLQGELTTVQEKSDSLEEELTSLRESMAQLLRDKENSAWELEQKFDELEEQNRKLLAEIASLNEAKTAEAALLTQSISELKEQLSLREGEYSALQETVQDLKSSGADASAIYDVGHVKAQLARVLSEKENLQERLRDEEGARKLLEDHVKSVDEEVSRLRTAFESAEKDKVEAETKLVVLSNYWKEKETHFHKELGLQEVMWQQKQGEETTAYDRIKSLQEEVESYKSQTDMLKKEIVDQERGLKSQIATLEKKAHENWVAARQAERRLDESKQEAGQLRNMLTLIEKSSTDGNAAASPRVPGELNGDGEVPLPPLLPDGTSPLPLPPLPMDPLGGPLPMLPPNFMPPFMPPPPFLPPPPHLLPGDRRLPPLGRMSSPPLNRFSPGPGDYGYDRMSPTVLSPPARSYRSPPTHRSSPWDEAPHRSGFRPVASHRDSRRDYQGSSSGHSSEESLEKHHTSRRGKV